MLAKIREKTQGIIATFILLFVALVFVIWGVNIDAYLDGSTTTVAKVNGMEIDQREYRQAVDSAQVTDLARKQMVLDDLIDQRLLADEAHDRGYRLGNVQLAQLIQQAPYFQRDGQFEPALYDALLRRQGLTPAMFEQRMRQNNVLAQVQVGLAESAFVTNSDANTLARLLQQERRFSYAYIRHEPFLAGITITPQDVEEYYQANQEKFRTPEAVRAAYVVLSAADVAKQVEVTEAELRQAYEADEASNVTPAKRRISHILITVPPGADEKTLQQAEARAEQLAKQARATKDFGALAKEHSDDKDSAAKGGDLGDLAVGLLPEVDKAVRTLKQGDVAGPVRSQYGFHVVKLTSYTPEVRRSFESVKRELNEQVRRRKAEERFYEIGERLRNLVYEHPEGLEPAAKELGLKIQTTDWFTRTGGKDFAASPRVKSAAFDPEVLSGERNSDVLELEDDSYAALHVIERRPSAVEPLAQVRDDIARTLKEQRAVRAARETAEEWVKKLEGGAKFEEIARSANVKLQTKNVSRVKTDVFERRLVEAVFAAPRPAQRPSFGYEDMGGMGFAVFVVEQVRDIDPAKVDTATKEKVKRDLTELRGADYYDRYRLGLRGKADISINKDLM
jgi:peptidyl-prolyl cis-trans isomerase D